MKILWESKDLRLQLYINDYDKFQITLNGEIYTLTDEETHRLTDELRLRHLSAMINDLKENKTS